MKTADAITLAFESMEVDIHGYARAFSSIYQMDFDDCLSEAFIGFLNGYNTWDADKGASLPYWVKKKVWFAMREMYRLHCRQSTRFHPTLPEQIDFLARDNSENASLGFFDWIDMRDEIRTMSANVKTLIDMALDMPPNVQEIALAKGGEIRNLRSSIRETLKTIGWSEKQITDSWKDVQVCL